MKRILFAVGGSLLFLALYLTFIFNLPSPTKYAISPHYKDVVITLERTMCLGTCPVYKLKIYGDGRVEYEGESYVGITGTQIGHISSDDVRDLVFEFYRIEYFSLRDEYIEAEPDLPTIITSITIDGHRKQVVDHWGAPPELKDLEKMIDDAAGSDRWVHGH
jgi:hypothetical protein